MTAPQHSITAQPRYIRPAAFDVERCVAERETMPDGGDGHPLRLYLIGESRYDLDAPGPVNGSMVCARDYLRPDHGCPEWPIRRLKVAEVNHCRDLGGDTGRTAAFARVMGPPGRPISDAKIEEYVDEHGMAEILAVGEAALRASEAPKAAEKKP